MTHYDPETYVTAGLVALLLIAAGIALFSDIHNGSN